MVHLVGVTITALAMAHPLRAFILLCPRRLPSAATVIGASNALASAPPVSSRSRGRPRADAGRERCLPRDGEQKRWFCTARMSSLEGTTKNGRVMGETGAALGGHKLGRGNEIFSLAPMMEYTDKHMRYMLRLLTKRTVLWTEMVPSSTIFHNPDDLDRFLGYNDDVEHPVVLQIGGSDPNYVRDSCKLVRTYKYDAINLNCGCPSDKVAGKGAFGAALMRHPSLVSELCLAMHEGVGGEVPVTVKCRIGVDDDDSYEQLVAFIDEVHRKGEVKHFIIHARKAILGGLSPAQNRSIPPLRYDYVYRLVKDFPELDFTLNGGVNTYEEALSCLEQGAHGVMVGRAWYSKPWYWSQADSKLFGTEDPGLTRREVLERYGEYGEREEKAAGERWLNCRRRLVKPVWNFFHGEQRGKKFRVHLERQLKADKPFGDILRESLLTMPPEQVDLVPGQGRPPRESHDNVEGDQSAEDATESSALDADPSCRASLPAAVAA